LLRRIDESTYELSQAHYVEDELSKKATFWDYVPKERVQKRDGGHNRARGHFIADRPLKCQLVTEGALLRLEDRIRIQDMRLIEGDQVAYDFTKTAFPNYR
jgi:hypothetical protein